jgi:hypothetical protein
MFYVISFSKHSVMNNTNVMISLVEMNVISSIFSTYSLENVSVNKFLGHHLDITNYKEHEIFVLYFFREHFRRQFLVNPVINVTT